MMDASCCRTTNSIGEPATADPTAAMTNRISRVRMIMGLPFCWDELILPDRGSRQRKIWRMSRSRMRWARGAGWASLLKVQSLAFGKFAYLGLLLLRKLFVQGFEHGNVQVWLQIGDGTGVFMRFRATL